MRTLAWPDTIVVSPGADGYASVAITNTSSVIDAYRVQVFGLDPEWVEVSPTRLSLFPGETANVDIHVRLPEDYPSSQRVLAVNVTSDDQPGSFSLTQVGLDVRPATKTTVALDPTMVTGGRSATFGLVVSNTGNAAVTATGFAIDPEDLAEFTFEPPQVIVAPGREQVIEVTVEGGRNWFGTPRARSFTVGVDPDGEDRVEALAVFVQRPRIGRSLLMLLGLLTAAAVFAAVLSNTFDRVVEEARVSTDVINAALASDQAGGAVIPSNPGSITGFLQSTSGDGFSGAQAELFLPANTDSPVASAATGDQGAFTFANLGAGTYLLRLSGSGVNEIWYGGTPTATDATTIELAARQSLLLPPIMIGGIPVEVAGTIDVGEATGVTVSLVVPGQLNPDGSSVIATVPVGADGSFSLPDVPSPGVYQLIVEAPGFAPETRDVVLQPGQPLSGVEISLRPGNGLIQGTVSGPGGALGGAQVIATDGTREIETVSLTEGAVGTFALRDLPTPGQYTVTITRDGFSSEARVVTLAPEQTEASFDARLIPAVGSIQGRALVSGAPARGLTVSISGGDVNRTTAVLSQGTTPGSYGFFGLPAPGTYTLTFSGANTIPQVRVIDLDPNIGTENATGVDVSLSPERTTVSGIVRDVDGSPAAQATVSLSDGGETLTFLTSDDPLGRFTFANVRPGAYTLTASRSGTLPVTVLVNVSATQPAPPLDLQLGAQASLTGRVTGFDPAVRTLRVDLYRPVDLGTGAPLATVSTDSTGRYTFGGLDAPASFVIAVFDNAGSADPLNIRVVTTQPGTVTTVPDIPVQLP
ncbi:MAG TPA: carboxypeptidase regulatory-like domain-containing protein [Ilumatobacteraceae bacterium]|nr:carboxypeptidase regulatory-like domain-containing protein [Ilumatobacteraceae bacterium]